MQVYTHHFVTVDTLMVPPPTGQGLMVRPAFSEHHRLLVPANMLQSEISRCAKHAFRRSQVLVPGCSSVWSAVLAVLCYMRHCVCGLHSASLQVSSCQHTCYVDALDHKALT